MFGTNLTFNKDIWPSASVSMAKSSLKDHVPNVFKLTESYVFFLAALEQEARMVCC